MAAAKKQLLLDANKPGKKIIEFGEAIRSQVIGQDEAVDSIQDYYNLYLAGLPTPGKPLGNFLFLGPTGTGKTKLVEAFTEIVGGPGVKPIKLDCAEFQSDHEIAKILGSPPGYLGHRETTAIITQQKLIAQHTEKNKASFVLFDEIEKAAKTVFRLLLGVLDKASLKLGDNTSVDFSQTFIFMTSNLGMRDASKILNSGFGYINKTVLDNDPDAHNSEKAKTDKSIQRALKEKFDPEFVNRLDRIVIFKTLTIDNLKVILDLELRAIQEQLVTNEKYFYFELTPRAKEFLIKSGTSVEFGARYLKRTLTKYVTNPFANLINSEQVSLADLVVIDYKGDDRLEFKKERM